MVTTIAQGQFLSGLAVLSTSGLYIKTFAALYSTKVKQVSGFLTSILVSYLLTMLKCTIRVERSKTWLKLLYQYKSN